VLVSDEVGLPEVMSFFCGKLEGYDYSLLESVSLIPLAGSWPIAGNVRYDKVQKGNEAPAFRSFRILGQVNLNPAIYPAEFIHELRVADASRDGRDHFQRMCAVFGNIRVAAVFALSHEAAHFLMVTGQERFEDCEGNANWIANKWTNEFCRLHSARV
jgi:hypothetical protein